jgi:hypothetical protein
MNRRRLLAGAAILWISAFLFFIFEPKTPATLAHVDSVGSFILLTFWFATGRKANDKLS